MCVGAIVEFRGQRLLHVCISPTQLQVVLVCFQHFRHHPLFNEYIEKSKRGSAGRNIGYDRIWVDAQFLDPSEARPIYASATYRYGNNP